MIHEPTENEKLSAIMVIFGGTGDLTHRKLMPALYNLVVDSLLPGHFAIVSVGRREWHHQQYREEVLRSLNKYSRNKTDQKYWDKLSELIYYYHFDFTDLDGYARLREYPSGAANLLIIYRSPCVHGAGQKL
ncbi:MAG TPA: hypothetical protein DD738_14055 [Ruminiclostridium sp.]|jgi:glucose-6-phosphate 1-dehydrogenase|nr:hypothetical protein [Ruminiclostridium sp.]